MIEKRPAYIAFQGGGALGMAHLGAWKALSQQFDIKGVAGTSAGSIVAAFCAAGFSPEHTIDIFRELNWSKLVKRQKRVISPFQWLFQQNGFSDGENFRIWLRDQLRRKINYEAQDISFDHLHKTTNIYLAIVACDLNKQSSVIFDKDKKPNDFISFAVRASISIPIFFKAVSIPNIGEELVDGGLLLNYPVELLYEQAQKENCALIGVRFKEKPSYLENPNIWETAWKSVQVMQKAANKLPDKITEYPNYIEITIDVEGFDFLEFKLTNDKKHKLVECGVAATKQAINEWKVKHQEQSQYPKERPSSKIFNPDLRYYIERPPIESNCDNQILKPGTLIRIKAPDKMGKTSLIRRILAHVPKPEYRTVHLSIESVEQDILANLKNLLQWLCYNVSKQLDVKNLVQEHWNENMLSNNDNCTAYFEEYLLPEINCPLVLALDDVDKLFSYQKVAEDFFGIATRGALGVGEALLRTLYSPVSAVQGMFGVEETWGDEIHEGIHELAFTDKEVIVNENVMKPVRTTIERTEQRFKGMKEDRQEVVLGTYQAVVGQREKEVGRKALQGGYAVIEDLLAIGLGIEFADPTKDLRTSFVDVVKSGRTEVQTRLIRFKDQINQLAVSDDPQQAETKIVQILKQVVMS